MEVGVGESRSVDCTVMGGRLLVTGQSTDGDTNGISRLVG